VRPIESLKDIKWDNCPQVSRTATARAALLIACSKNLFKPKPRMQYRQISMVKSSRSAVKTLTINRSRDIVVDKLTKQCEEGNHSKCTGWAVLKKEHSPINANYFLKCTCSCHKKGLHIKKKKTHGKRSARKVKKQVRKKKVSRKSRRGRR
jgi:hypothetical protein